MYLSHVGQSPTLESECARAATNLHGDRNIVTQISDIQNHESMWPATTNAVDARCPKFTPTGSESVALAQPNSWSSEEAAESLRAVTGVLRRDASLCIRHTNFSRKVSVRGFARRECVASESRWRTL